VAGQVGEKTVKAHGNSQWSAGERSWSSTAAQRGHRQALLRNASGRAWITAGSMLTL